MSDITPEFNPPPSMPVAQGGGAYGAFSGDIPRPNIGLLGIFGPFFTQAEKIPNQACGLMGLAFGKATGVFAASERGMGVHGVNDAPQGSSRKPNFGCGVWGESANGLGVFGSSDNNVGVWGESQASNGVFGISHHHQNAAISAVNDAGGLGLWVTGNAHVQGDVEVTGDICLMNADCAEDFDIAGIEKIEPGTVMVLDQEGALQPSQQAYDKKVAGVVSGAGNLKPGIILDKQQPQGNRMPIALMGKVYCKVDANYGEIEVGDLLTTSPTPGYAMKTSDPLKAFGAVIGKALRPLTEGQGLIPILIALQ